MNVQEVLKFIDASMFAKKGKHLNDVQRLIIQATWSERQCYAQIAKTNSYCASYLKQNAGPKLWKQLSEVFGKKIIKTNFRATMERLAGLVSHEGGVIPSKPNLCDRPMPSAEE